MRVNSGADLQSLQMGGDVVGETGTATATSATSLTNSGASFPTTGNAYKGHIVVAGSAPLVYGVITSNTATVLTVDKWYVAATPGGAAAATPAATATYIILPGGMPAFWIALSTDTTAPAATDTAITGELTGNGLQRQQATFAHTFGGSSASYTLSKVFTSADATARTIAKSGVINAAVGGLLLFEDTVPNAPTLQSGDTLTLTYTVNI